MAEILAFFSPGPSADLNLKVPVFCRILTCWRKSGGANIQQNFQESFHAVCQGPGAEIVRVAFEAIHLVVEVLDDSRVLAVIFFSLVVVQNPGTVIGIFSGGDDFFVWRRFA